MKMKKVLTVIIAALGFTGFVNAQNSTGTSTATAPAATVTTVSTAANTDTDEAECYCCPKADYCSTQPGKCALHYNIDLVKDGEYFCPVIDNVTSGTQGYCPGTGNAMLQMEATDCIGGSNMEQKAQGSKKGQNQKKEGISAGGESQAGK